MRKSSPERAIAAASPSAPSARRYDGLENPANTCESGTAAATPHATAIVKAMTKSGAESSSHAGAAQGR